ncbi:MAG TPA: SprT-like domain-containing protein [Gemmatimonadaceae bacterium]|nr:SprT-like domain-containing protein [Gemmatimonadaceae bacterium]
MTRRSTGRGLLHSDPRQLELGFRAAPRDAEELHRRLARLGLRGITRVRLTRNRAVMVSFSRHVLRVHHGYLDAPDDVLRAIVRFVVGRTRADRRAAERIILEYPIQVPGAPSRARRERVHPDDVPFVEELVRWHRDYNVRYFRGALSDIPIRVSRRMRARLGQYTTESLAGEPAEIVLSRQHIRRHGWAETLHTLLHEMVHQWQAESGRAIDHGPAFRAKAREVGIAPRARRALTAARRAEPVHEVVKSAAREG